MRTKEEPHLNIEKETIRLLPWMCAWTVPPGREESFCDDIFCVDIYGRLSCLFLHWEIRRMNQSYTMYLQFVKILSILITFINILALCVDMSVFLCEY